MLIYYIVHILAFIVFAFAMADVWSTNRAIAAGASEGNPLVAFIMRMIGDKWVIVRLIFAQLNIWLVLHDAKDTNSWIGLTSFGLNIALMIYVIWNNINVYNKQIAK